MWRAGQRFLRSLGLTPVHPRLHVARQASAAAPLQAPSHGGRSVEQGSALLRQLVQQRREHEATDLFHQLIMEGRAGPADVKAMVRAVEPQRVNSIVQLAVAEGIPVNQTVLHMAMSRATQAGPTRPMELALLALRTLGTYPPRATLEAMLRTDMGFVADYMEALLGLEGVSVPPIVYNDALLASMALQPPDQSLALVRTMQAAGVAMQQEMALRLVNHVANSAPALLVEALHLANQIDPLAQAQPCNTALAGLVDMGQLGSANELLAHMTISGVTANQNTLRQLAGRLARNGDHEGVLGAMEHGLGCGDRGALDTATLQRCAEALGRAGHTSSLAEWLGRARETGIEISVQMYAPIVMGAAERESPEGVEGLVRDLEAQGVALGGVGVCGLAVAHARAQQCDKALGLLDEAVAQHTPLPASVFVAVLRELDSGPHSLPMAERVLELARMVQITQAHGRRDWEELHVAALGLFGRCGAADHVGQLARSMRQAKVALSVPVALAMLEAYAGSGQANQVRNLYQHLAARPWPTRDVGTVHGAAAQAFAMLQQISAMEKATVAAIEAGADLATGWPAHVLGAFRVGGREDTALRLLDALERAKLVRPDHYESVIAGLARLGKIDDARQLLNRAAEAGVVAGAELYAGLLGAYRQAGELGRMEELFVLMQREGIQPPLSVYNSMIAAYGTVGDTAKVRGMLGAMLGDGLAPDTDTYTATIGAYATAQDYANLRRLYGALAARPGAIVPPILLAFYRAFAAGREQDDLQRVVGALEDSARDSHTVVGVLVAHHIRAGHVDRVVDLIGQAHERGTQLDASTYEEAITALMQAGNQPAALDLYLAMRPAGPPTPSLALAVLGCSVDQGNLQVTSSLLADINTGTVACSPPPALLLRAHLVTHNFPGALQIWKSYPSVGQSTSTDTLLQLALALANLKMVVDAREVLAAVEAQQAPLPALGLEVQAMLCAASGDMAGVEGALAAIRGGGTTTLHKHTFRTLAKLYARTNPASAVPALLETWGVRGAEDAQVAYVVAWATLAVGHLDGLASAMAWLRARTGPAQPLWLQQFTKLVLAGGLMQQPEALRQALHALGLQDTQPPPPPQPCNDQPAEPAASQHVSSLLWAELHTRRQAETVVPNMVKALLQADCIGLAVGLAQHMVQGGMAIDPHLQLQLFTAMATSTMWPQAHWLAGALPAPTGSCRPNVDDLITSLAATCPGPLQAILLHYLLQWGVAPTARPTALGLLGCSNDWDLVLGHIGQQPSSSAMATALLACVHKERWLAIEEGVKAMQAHGIKHTVATYRCLLAARSHLADVDGTRLLVAQLRADSDVETECLANALIYEVLRVCARLGLYDDVIATYQHYKGRPIGARLNRRPVSVMQALSKLGRWDELWDLYKARELGPVSWDEYEALVEGLVTAKHRGRLREVVGDLAAADIKGKEQIIQATWEGFRAMQLAKEMYWAHQILAQTSTPTRDHYVHMLRVCGRQGTAVIVRNILEEMESRRLGLDREVLTLSVSGLVSAGDVGAASSIALNMVRHRHRMGSYMDSVKAVARGWLGQGKTGQAVEFVRGVHDLGGHLDNGTYKRLLWACREVDSGVDAKVVETIEGWLSMNEAREDGRSKLIGPAEVEDQSRVVLM